MQNYHVMFLDFLVVFKEAIQTDYKTNNTKQVSLDTTLNAYNKNKILERYSFLIRKPINFLPTPTNRTIYTVNYENLRKVGN